MAFDVVLLFFLSLAVYPEAEAVGAEPAQAPASPPASEDEVRLHARGFMLGRIVEFVPKSHVVFLSTTGAYLRFALSAVTYIRRGDAVLLSSSGEAEPQTTRAMVGRDVPAPVPQVKEAKQRELDLLRARVPGPRVHLQLQANVPARFQQRIGNYSSRDRSAYRLVWVLPCDVDIPVADSQPYRVDAIL